VTGIPFEGGIIEDEKDLETIELLKNGNKLIYCEASSELF
jgi:hypothetical protein